MSIGAALGKAPKAAIAIEAKPLDTHDAAAELLRAVEAKDSKAVAAALEMAYQACKDREASYGKDDGDGDGGY